MPRLCLQASPEEIKAQFRKLALATHPDKAGGAASPAFAAIRDAYQTLSDPERRRAYDATLVQHLDMQVGRQEWRAHGGGPYSGVGRAPRGVVVACSTG